MVTDGEQKNKTLLLREEELSDLDEDEFDHAAYVDTIERILGEEGPPWHIGLFGTWGSGKSSIISILYDRIEKANPTSKKKNAPKYDFRNTVAVRTNAWEHTGDSVKTALLLDLNRELDLKIPPISDDTDVGLLDSEEILETLYDVEEKEREKVSGLASKLKEFAPRGAALIVGFALAIAVIFTLVQFTGFQTSEVILTLVGSGFIVGVIQLLLMEYRQKEDELSQRTMVNPRNEWSGAYKDIYQDILDAASTKFSESNDVPGDKLEHIVITVDDLDRCESQSVYETLISLKSFMNHDRCSYIIPCEEDALYRHIMAADTGTYLDQRENQHNFLAKFFQTQLRIPELEMGQLESFIKGKQEQLTESLPDDIVEEVLSESYINTPRRVIQLLNRITVMRILAEQRADFEAIDTENDDHLMFLAKVAILQEDHPEFYRALERGEIALQSIYNEWDRSSGTAGQAATSELFEGLGIPRDRHMDLLRFLIATRNIDQDLGPYLRLAGSELSELERFVNALEQNRVLDCGRIITDTDSTLQADCIDEIQPRLFDDELQYDVFRLSLQILEKFNDSKPDHRATVAKALFEVLEQGDHKVLLTNIDLTQLRPCIERLEEKQRIQILRWYVEAAVSKDRIQDENLQSVLRTSPQELELLYEVRDEFAENMAAALNAGTISKPRYDEIVDEINRGCRQLYSHQLVDRGRI